MSVVDLTEYMDRPIDWAERARKREIERRREAFRRAIGHLADDMERAQDHCRALIDNGASVYSELNELIDNTRAALLVARLLQREAGHG